MSNNKLSVDELKAKVDQDLGTSRWFPVTQERIDQFADLTEDPQWIHIDPERAAKETPFGGTIAHGFLSLSLLSAMAMDVVPGVQGTVMGINYGFGQGALPEPGALRRPGARPLQTGRRGAARRQSAADPLCHFGGNRRRR